MIPEHDIFHLVKSNKKNSSVIPELLSDLVINLTFEPYDFSEAFLFKMHEIVRRK